jgi:hypothetical protein
MMAARGTGKLGTSALVCFLGVSGCGARSELAPVQDYPAELDGGASPDVAADAPPDVSVPDSAPACEALDDGGACNRLAATGAPVNVTCAPAGAVTPTPSGGLIADGTYLLHASRFYGLCTGLDRQRITWVLCGDAWSTVQEDDIDGRTTTQNVDGNVAIGGTSFTFTPTCPAAGVPVTTFGYDATPTTLRIYVYGYGTGRVRVDDFERQ